MVSPELRAVVVRGLRDDERRPDQRGGGVQEERHPGVLPVPPERRHPGLLQATLRQHLPRRLRAEGRSHVL